MYSNSASQLHSPWDLWITFTKTERSPASPKGGPGFEPGHTPATVITAWSSQLRQSGRLHETPERCGPVSRRVCSYRLASVVCGEANGWDRTNSREEIWSRSMI